MLPKIREKLLALSNEQLVFLIEEYRNKDIAISNILVNTGRCITSPEGAIEDIRDCCIKYDVDLGYRFLGDWIDWQIGKITAEEYHKRVYENGKDVID